MHPTAADLGGIPPRPTGRPRLRSAVGTSPHGIMRQALGRRRRAGDVPVTVVGRPPKRLHLKKKSMPPDRTGHQTCGPGLPLSFDPFVPSVRTPLGQLSSHETRVPPRALFCCTLHFQAAAGASFLSNSSSGGELEGCGAGSSQAANVRARGAGTPSPPPAPGPGQWRRGAPGSREIAGEK